jgi:phage-related protein
MAIYKGFTFDGINSLDYGIHITGEAVYNAPERDVEMISIPGRNGEFALDNERFNNIAVKYRAGTFGQDQPDFAGKIDAFRNAIVSRLGYCRITDGYNPDEYRMAIYKSGLEVSPVANSKAGEFDIVFDCKPQRFLLSGETKQTITSGQTLTNPTLFKANPLLEVEGYGAINMGDESVVIHNEPVGRVSLAVTQTILENTASTFKFSVAVNDPTVYQTGDEITFLPGTVQMRLKGSVYRAEISDKSNMGARANGSGGNFLLYLDIPTLIAESGVDGATYTGWADVTIKTSHSA